MAFLKFKKRTGFTLVELMIVVAIIGIIAGIAVPRYISFIQRSKEANTKGNLGIIRSAISIYYADAQHFPLVIAIDPDNPGSLDGADGYAFQIQDDFKNYIEDIPNCTLGPAPNAWMKTRRNVYHKGLTGYTPFPEPHDDDVGWWYCRSTDTVSGLAVGGRIHINVFGSDRRGEYYTSW
ncbi:MAG: prepilin-type N-terminal cleavage/methylation domain-containing protein [bacterium]|nr:prepilin-type N-terminal cleavage/methylation domain-containing protein [bacterium]MDD5757332.1 prepilin-type N-terminal cleavage/methylation domain-containing protein [bacterium]